jgi:hypothetical protein
LKTLLEKDVREASTETSTIETKNFGANTQQPGVNDAGTNTEDLKIFDASTETSTIETKDFGANTQTPGISDAGTTTEDLKTLLENDVCDASTETSIIETKNFASNTQSPGISEAGTNTEESLTMAQSNSKPRASRVNREAQTCRETGFDGNYFGLLSLRENQCQLL